jgi:hypothetical protein
MSKRPKIGDIVEIPLPDSGTGYAQYTHKHKQYGALLRVLKVREKVVDIKELSNAHLQFTTFFPLSAAVNREIVRVAGNLPIKDELKSFLSFVLAFLTSRAWSKLGGCGMEKVKSELENCLRNKWSFRFAV